MTQRPDRHYKWIGHYLDHWSKFHILFPLMHKSASEVAWNLESKVFSYIGLPRILQSDNGREFVNSLVAQLVKDWPEEVTIVNGRPRHPQSQGAVEKANGTVEALLAVRIHEFSGDDAPWTSWLPFIQCRLLLVTRTMF